MFSLKICRNFEIMGKSRRLDLRPPFLLAAWFELILNNRLLDVSLRSGTISLQIENIAILRVPMAH